MASSNRAQQTGELAFKGTGFFFSSEEWTNEFSWEVLANLSDKSIKIE